MHSRNSPTSLIVTFISLAGFLGLSCSQQYNSYGILVWSSDEAKIASGSVVGVTSHSDLKNTYDFVFVAAPVSSAAKTEASAAPGQLAAAPSPGMPNVTDKPVFTAESWRLKVFGNEGDARAWAASHSTFARQFARSLRQALPVREKADRTTAMLYRLREGELAKIVDRAPTETNEGGLSGYWYEITTETGVNGWVFSAQLDIVDLAATGGTAIVSDDPKLQQILSGNWRPEEFAAMIEYKQFDLTIFNPRNGLFIDNAKKVVHIVLPKDQMDFNFTSIDKLRGDNYQVAGTSLQLSFRDDTSIVAQWTKNSSVKSHVFINTTTSITDLYNAELSRRDAMYQAFLANGGAIQSDSYGEIKLSPDKTFNWTNLGSLQPRIVPSSAKGSGMVDFAYYLGSALQGRYQGVITFDFDTGLDSEAVSFLYNIRQDGIQLEYVSTTGLRDLVISKNELSPTVLFFHF